MSGKKTPSIDSHLYNPARTERRYFVTSAARLAPRTSIRHRLSKLNQPGGFFNLSGNTFNPNLKTWAILFLVVVGAVSGGVLAQGALFHSYAPNPAYHSGNDPDIVTQLWDAADGSNSGADFQFSNQTAYLNSCGVWVGASCWLLEPSSSISAEILSHTSFDPSPVSGKHFKMIFFWRSMNLASWPVGKRVEFFLTRNGTLPNNSELGTYDPFSDKNVALIYDTQMGSGGTFNIHIYVQHTVLSTIASSNPDTQGCNSGGDCFMGQTMGTANYNPQATVVQSAFWMNFTGNSNTLASNCASSGVFPQGGASCSVMINTDAAVINAQTGFGVWEQSDFLFQSQTYYLGILAQKGIVANLGSIQIGLDKGTIPIQIDPTGSLAAGLTHSVQLGVAQIISTIVTISPTIDTGGFFGPVIKALISIGVFIVQNLLGFASYIWGFIQPAFTTIINLLIVGLAGFATIIVGVIKAILNVIGSGLGIPSLGDNLFTLFGDVSSFFTTFFANALAQVSSFITFLNNGYSTVSASFGTYWTDLVNWTSAIKDLLGGIWVIAGILLTIPFTFAFSGWMLYGAKKFSDSTGEGMEWFSLTRLGLLIGFNIALWLLQFLISHVITPSLHAIMATGEAKKTAEPDIVIGGTGVG